MSDDGDRAQQPLQPASRRNPGFWDRCDTILGNINRRFHFFVSLPVVTALGSFLYSHVDYLTTYQNRIKEIGEQQIKAAEGTYSDVSKTFSQAITLQQLLFFNYRDAVQAGTQDDDSRLEALQLAVRTRAGVPAGVVPLDEVGDLVAVGDDGRAVLTVRGRLLANEVAVRLR